MLKIAIDADIPRKVLNALAALYGGKETEFVWIPDLVPANTPDEFWADKFRQVGGRVTISADKAIANHPHQLLAFKRNELTCFFMQPPWSMQRLHMKAAHLIYWWPAIEKQIEKSKVGDAWQVPYQFSGGEMKELRLPDEAIKQAEIEIAEKLVKS
jgi:hypothetical protein